MRSSHPSRRARLAVSLLSIAIVVGSPALSSAAAAPLESTDLGTIQNIVEPTLSDGLTIGSVLTVDTGTWNPSDVTFSYEWSAGDCCSWSGVLGTGPTHTITESDSYFGYVSVSLTISKEGYEPVTRSLTTERVIANPPAVPFASPNELTAANKRGVTATTEGTVATISIPGAGPGIQYFVYGYSLGTPLGFFITNEPEDNTWRDAYEIVVDYSELGGGPQRLVVLSASGYVMGWTWVDDEPLDPPVPDSSGLTEQNNGGAESEPTGTPNEVLIDVPGAEPGESVQLDAYSEPTRLGWYTVDSNRQVRVNYSILPVGEHRIAITNSKGTLLGWVPVTAVEVSLANTGPVLAPAVPVTAGALLSLAGLLMFLARRRARLG